MNLENLLAFCSKVFGITEKGFTFVPPDGSVNLPPES